VTNTRHTEFRKYIPFTVVSPSKDVNTKYYWNRLWLERPLGLGGTAVLEDESANAKFFGNQSKVDGWLLQLQRWKFYLKILAW